MRDIRAVHRHPYQRTMLPIKKETAPALVPVSRVTLSARLSQLAGNLLRPSSRAETPTPYITSSLNPSRNTPVTGSAGPQGDGFQKTASGFDELSVVKNLGKFESLFSDLSLAISSFKDHDLDTTVKDLLKTSDEIHHDLEQLQKHHDLGLKVKALEEEKQSLEALSKHILRELMSYRAQLKKLPRLPAAPTSSQQNLKNVDVQTVLDYAMKLAKFSRAPATVHSQFIHPNNYIWPAEDALRRGMLAVASLDPDALIKAEFGDAKTAESPDEMEIDTEEKKTEPNGHHDHDAKPAHASERRSGAPVPAPASTSLDLDLFDPDEEDSD